MSRFVVHLLMADKNVTAFCTVLLRNNNFLKLQNIYKIGVLYARTSLVSKEKTSNCALNFIEDCLHFLIMLDIKLYFFKYLESFTE